MKRVVGLVLIFLLVVFVYQFVIVLLQEGHDISYKIASDNIEFTINETYKKEKREDGYLIDIKSSDNKEYVYYLNNNYNKQKKIIKKIATFQKDDYMCIAPTTIDGKLVEEILCNDGKDVSSYEYVNSKVDISAFLDQLNLRQKYVDNKTGEMNEDNVKIYKNNFYDNEYLEVYRYKYLAVMNKGVYNTYTFSQNDIYKNDLGVYINNYFIVPIVNKNQITDYYIIDVKAGTNRVIFLPTAISKNIYNIGVVDNKLYIFDLNNKEEHVIDPKDATHEVIGDVNSGFKFYENGKWVDKNVTDFNKEMKFGENTTPPQLPFSYDNIYESDNQYYLVDGNKVYKVYKNKVDYRILLFEINNYNNLTISKDRIYYIKDSTLYRFDKYGTKTLVNNNEFKYNNTNIYYVYND